MRESSTDQATLEEGREEGRDECRIDRRLLEQRDVLLAYGTLLFGRRPSKPVRGLTSSPSYPQSKKSLAVVSRQRPGPT
jgi:hypothetical protein